jgi:hypothetical protein
MLLSLKVPKIFRERNAIAEKISPAAMDLFISPKKQVANFEYGFIAVND